MEKVEISHPISTILNGTNYVIWAQEMSRFLKGKKLWCYIIGDILQPIKREYMKTSNYIVLLKDEMAKTTKLLLAFVILMFQ